jgi:hypothetical protein
MKKMFQISLMLIFALSFSQIAFSQNSTGHLVCCRCEGKGAWFSTFLDANSNVQILQTNCGTCSGTGIGTCEKNTPRKPEPPKPVDGFSDPYFQYLLDMVKTGGKILSPDEYKRRNRR